MNLIETAFVTATRSVAARPFGAFVPVGENGSGARLIDCLVKPARVFPLGRFAFFMRCVGHVVLPLADLVFGTLLRRSPIQFAQPTGPSIPNVQPPVEREMATV